MQKNVFDTFTCLYSLSKTLRFELRPIDENGRWITDQRFENFTSALQGIIGNDNQRAKYYKQAKPLIDEYHRYYIDEKLESPVDPKTDEAVLDEDNIVKAFECYRELRNAAGNRRQDTEAFQAAQKKWSKFQDVLRKSLVKCFGDKKDHLFSKTLIKSTLPEWLEKQGRWEENRACVEAFEKFTGYFIGYNQNRENMYVDEPQKTAIAFRLMNENLSKFFNNCLAYEKIRKNHSDLVFSADNEIPEKSHVADVLTILEPGFFLKLFTQSGIDAYNTLIGGINKQINLYRQKHDIKPRNLPNLTPLYKQILSDRESHSFILEEFENDQNLLDTLRDFVNPARALIEKLKTTLETLPDSDLDRVYIRGSELRTISQWLFNDYSFIGSAQTLHAENIFPSSPKGKVTKKLEKEREKYPKQDVFSIAELDDALKSYIELRKQESPDEEFLSGVDTNFPVRNYFLTEAKKWKNHQGLQDAIQKFETVCSSNKISADRRAPGSDNETDGGGEGYRQVQSVRNMLDEFMTFLQLTRPLHLVRKGKPIDIPDMDMSFYADFSAAYENYQDRLLPLYNKTRNYLTKKPYSPDKIKLNFDKPNFLEGWDLNKEKANLGVLLRRDDNYFLAVMRPEHNNVFRNYPTPEGDEEIYGKINYKQISGMNKMLPKVFFSKKWRKEHDVPGEIDTLYKNEEHIQNENFNQESLHKLIDFFKARINEYEKDGFPWRNFDFHFPDTKEYQNIADFYREVEEQAYKIWFIKVPVSHIENLVREEKIFLFQIYNKDFSQHSKGRPNLHTLYWRALFEKKNLNNVVIKLNGGAEVFYRPHSIKENERIIHKAHQSLNNKNKNNPRKTSCFAYEIVKDRRYTQDKFLFHVPLTLNFKAPKAKSLNDCVNNAIRNEPDVHIIGIDRGERHLLYLTVIDQKGNIVKQCSLNEIETDKNYNVQYREKLDQKEKERDKARKSWSSIENIKDLKSGYLSQIVHSLANLIIEYNAIVCLEDLNFGFKRGRFMIEKQVYQKFEKALIDKLNYLVFKDAKPGQAGHYLKAYQLTGRFRSFEKLGKQSGILYYVPAAYTSKADPATGFVNFLYPKYESLEKSKQFFSKMELIRYNTGDEYFEFTFKYSNFPIRQDLKNYPDEWTICTHGDARYWNKRENNRWISEEINVTQQLAALLDSKNIDYRDGRDIKQDIAAAKDTKFYKKLYRLLQVTLSLRYSKSGTDIDFILSPTRDKSGTFFDSRQAPSTMPENADANGAYHIALKGLWHLQQLRKQEEGQNLKLEKITNSEWFDFLIQQVKKS